ncbi:MAG: ABC transporter substrate-binding protein [Alphaproteobacteria bacterium]|nr:ABC transporter substrate-binding protein [Alphaproteobacteria bacterium]
MKNIIVISTAIFFIIFAVFLFNVLKNTSKNKEEIVTVRVCKVIEHEALNSVVLGMSDYLKSQNKKYKIIVETCQGNMALASQILEKFASKSSLNKTNKKIMDIVVTIGTIPSQAAFKIAKDRRLRVVFSSVTNPIDISADFANLKKNSNMTGVSNFVQLKPQLELFQKIQPSLKKLGMLYNTGEANSTYIIKNIDPICKDMGITLIRQGISKISELPQSIEKLAKNCDAVFISNDNMSLSGISNIISICSKYKIPVYVSDTDQVEKGCVAALGPNQYDIGAQTGKIVKRIADGEDINNIAIEYPKKTELYINLNTHLEIPDELISQAKKIFK